MINNRDVYAAVGGRPVLERVHKLLYDRLFSHPWLGAFFAEVEQDFIESQQTDFMSSVSGGPKSYVGQPPLPSHVHMFLNEEIFELRHKMLDVSIREAGVPEEAREAWLKLDRSFVAAVVKKSVGDCKQRYSFEGIVAVAKPAGYSQATDPALVEDTGIKRPTFGNPISPLHAVGEGGAP
ncbi:MAG: hemoglobin, partial [Planctomycetota bacterium]